MPAEQVGWYVLPLALGNFCGPLLLGRLFDVVGRRVMISFTYATSGMLLALNGYAFQQGWLDVTQQAAAWMVIFFFASAAASSAYLTVAETFPLEIRALAIAVFYAFGTGLGGIIGPTLFGQLIQTQQRGSLLIGYLAGAALMCAAAAVQAVWGCLPSVERWNMWPGLCPRLRIEWGRLSKEPFEKAGANPEAIHSKG